MSLVPISEIDGDRDSYADWRRTPIKQQAAPVTGLIVICLARSARRHTRPRNIAEILSGFVLADLGIAHHPRPDHAAYLASWLDAIKQDPRAIFKAASKAQQAADWMHAQQPGGGSREAPTSADKPSDPSSAAVGEAA